MAKVRRSGRKCPIFLRQGALLGGNKRSWYLLPDLDDVTDIAKELLKDAPEEWHLQELTRHDAGIYSLSPTDIVICVPVEDTLAVQASFSRIRRERSQLQATA